MKNLIGKEMTMSDLAERLVKNGYEDISYFKNWNEILDEGNLIVVKCDSEGTEHLYIEFEVTVRAVEEVESLMASYIEITNIN